MRVFRARERGDKQLVATISTGSPRGGIRDTHRAKDSHVSIRATFGHLREREPVLFSSFSLFSVYMTRLDIRG